MKCMINDHFIVLCVMSLITFAFMGIDKALAKKGLWRIPEKTLFALAVFGGALGGVVGMQVFRHKTKHTSFKLGMPLLLILNIGVLICLIK